MCRFPCRMVARSVRTLLQTSCAALPGLPRSARTHERAHRLLLDVAMRLDFRHHVASGSVAVDVRPNAHPADLGCNAASLGLPVCTARIETTARGYRAMCGWIQVVRSTDSSTGGEGFDMDPFAPSGTDCPYAFYGLAPTLFDGPSRDHRDDFDWLAHAFLGPHPAGNPRGGGRAGLLLGLHLPKGGGADHRAFSTR